MRPVNWSNPVNFNHGLNKGLLAWWLNVPHWQGGTVFRNLTSKYYQGTLTNMEQADWVKTDRPGGWGALAFDATEGEYIAVDIGNTPIFTAGKPYTICWWEKITADTDGFPGRFVFDISGDTDTFIITRVKDDAVFRYLTWGFSPNAAFEPMRADIITPANAVGLWVHLCVTGTSPTSGVKEDHRAYENGISAVIADPSSNFGTHTTPNRIGYRGNGNGANCQMDDIRIYNRRLSDAEVKQYFELSQQFYPGIFNRTMKKRVSLLASAALTGTAADTIDEADVVAGGKTIILTLTNDTWIPA